MIWLFCVLSLASSSCAYLFSASFEDGSLSPFVLSENARYAGQKVSVSDGSVVLEDANHFYGVGAPMSSVFDPSEGLVVQFEVQLTEGLTCGGAYVKALESFAKDFDDKSPFVVMFGPDKCGTTDKVHFIVRSQNKVSKEWQEHHLKSPPRIANDKLSHLYTLVVTPSDDFEILIDGEQMATGNLLGDSFEPPFIPAEEIDDPEDKKPEDWVDAKKIADPWASKPEDWDEDAPRKITDPSASKPEDWLDDEPLTVPDPEATKPEDWDDDEDGEWEAPDVDNPKCAKKNCGTWEPPVIDNPAYKGKWSAPQIDNPAYKGPWAPQRIKNPNYHPVTEFTKTLMKPIGALVVDIWTTNSGITYSNFALGDRVEDVNQVAEPFYLKKKQQQEQKEQEKKLKKQQKHKNKSFLAKTTRRLQEELRNQPQAVIVTALLLVVTLVFLACFGGKKKKPNKAPSSTTSGKKEKPAQDKDKDDDDDEDEDEDERSKPPVAD